MIYENLQAKRERSHMDEIVVCLHTLPCNNVDVPKGGMTTNLGHRKCQAALRQWLHDGRIL